jgi:lipopolysaccharide export LptBFGC system permease protein LptF
MEIIWALLGFFAFVTLAFIAIAFYFPEWVGITGDKAREIQEHQKSDLSSGKPDSSQKENSKSKQNQ